MDRAFALALEAGSTDPWFIATNLLPTRTLADYARRLAVKKMFSDLKVVVSPGLSQLQHPDVFPLSCCRPAVCLGAVGGAPSMFTQAASVLSRARCFNVTPVPICAPLVSQTLTPRQNPCSDERFRPWRLI